MNWPKADLNWKGFPANSAIIDVFTLLRIEIRTWQFQGIVIVDKGFEEVARRISRLATKSNFPELLSVRNLLWGKAPRNSASTIDLLALQRDNKARSVADLHFLSVKVAFRDFPRNKMSTSFPQNFISGAHVDLTCRELSRMTSVKLLFMTNLCATGFFH